MKTKSLECKKCGDVVKGLALDVGAVTCEYCVSCSVGAPEMPKSAVVLTVEEVAEKKERKRLREEKKAQKLQRDLTRRERGETNSRGRGWHKKRVVCFAGQWYSYGEEITPEQAEAIQNTPIEKPQTGIKTGRGKGWHLKRLFHWEGKSYSFGKEITAAEAAKLGD